MESFDVRYQAPLMFEDCANGLAFLRLIHFLDVLTFFSAAFEVGNLLAAYKRVLSRPAVVDAIMSGFPA